MIYTVSHLAFQLTYNFIKLIIVKDYYYVIYNHAIPIDVII